MIAGGMGRAVAIAVLIMNVLTLLVFGLDKWKARRGSWRVPEAHLLLLAFATGFAGAWIGMSLFRHKTRKPSFRWKLLAVTVLNPAWALLWFFLRGG